MFNALGGTIVELSSFFSKILLMTIVCVYKTIRRRLVLNLLRLSVGRALVEAPPPNLANPAPIMPDDIVLKGIVQHDTE